MNANVIIGAAIVAYLVAAVFLAVAGALTQARHAS